MSADNGWHGWDGDQTPRPPVRFTSAEIPADTQRAIAVEQLKLAETVRALGEVMAGHRRYLIEQGFSEEAAEQLAGQLHALVAVRWFSAS